MKNAKLRIGLSLLPAILLLAWVLFSYCKGRDKGVSTETATAGILAGTVFEISDSLVVGSVADTLDFGSMREGEVVSKEFRIKNISDRPLVVINVESSCGCTLFGFNREPVQSGEEKIITASFDSAGYMGEIVKKASLHTSLSPTPHTIIVEARVE